MKKLVSFLSVLLVLNSFSQNTHSLNFDGVDDYVNVGHFAYAPRFFSLQTWVKPSVSINSNHETIFSSDPRSALYHIKIKDYGNDQYGWLECGLRSNGVWFTVHYDLRTRIDEWVNIAMTFDENDSIKLYIDGVLIDQISAEPLFRELDTLNVLDTASIGIGNIMNNEDPFSGKIADFSYWSIPLSESSIPELMECPPVISDVASYWSFNEGVGRTSNDEGFENRDAVLRNGVSWSSDVPLQCGATSIQPLEAIKSYEVYPNPVSDFINIENLSIGDVVEFSNCIGQQLFSKVVSQEGCFSLNLSNLEDGVYFVLVNNSHSTFVIKE